MPNVLIEPVNNQLEIMCSHRKRWTRDEVRALAEAGTADIERLELIEGELYDTMGKGVPHMLIVHQMVELLREMFGSDRVVQEGSIEVETRDRQTSEPEPDAIVLNRSVKSFTKWVTAADLSLLVEVSDSSLRFDLNIKANLYARACIADYWVVDVKARRVIVHRSPSEGRFRSVASYDVTESIAPLAAPQQSQPQDGRYTAITSFAASESVVPSGAPQASILVDTLFV